MSALTKFNSFVEALAEKTHNLQSDTLKVMFSNVAPVVTNAVKADITEIAAVNGYTAGGVQATLVSSAQTSGTYRLIVNDVTVTASGGSFGPLRYVVLYNDTATNKELIGWYDYGSSLSVTLGNSFLTDFDQVNGVLTLA